MGNGKWKAENGDDRNAEDCNSGQGGRKVYGMEVVGSITCNC
jgi:hypothetical protein